MIGTGPSAYRDLDGNENNPSWPEVELRDELEQRLRKSSRDRKQLETELDTATDRWRSEKRRLHEEIDSLRKATEDAQKYADGGKEIESRLGETQRYSRQLEIKCEEQTVEYEFRENRNKSKIEDLENRIVELLDRSGNELRVKQGLEDHMATELEARKRSLEAEFRRGTKSNEDRWQGERRRLTVEIERLKKQASARKLPPAPSSFMDRLFSRTDRR